MRPTLRRPRISSILALLIFLSLGGPTTVETVEADGIFIPAPDRSDGTFGADQRIVYIASGDRVLRYDLNERAFLAPLILDGHLKAIDLSPDGTTLAIADASCSQDQIWVYLAHLDAAIIEKVSFARYGDERGSFAVAYGSDGKLLITSDSPSSVWAPLRSYDSQLRYTTDISVVRHDTMVSASPERDVIAYASPDSHRGPWGRYYVSSQTLLPSDPADESAYDIAVSRNAAQFAVLTADGADVFDSSLVQIASLGCSDDGRPIGATYHPRKDLLYTAWEGTSEIRVFETSEFSQIDSYNISSELENNRSSAFTSGRLRISSDGSLLLTTVDGGVRVIRTDAAQTLTWLETSFSQAITGSPLVLLAKVQRLTPASGTPSGPVSFYRQESSGRLTRLGSSTLNGEGEGSITVAFDPGTYDLLAVYDGNLEDRTSTSNPVTVEIQRATTDTELDEMYSQPVYGQKLMFAVTVDRTSNEIAAVPTGSVEILEGPATLGFGPIGTSGRALVHVPALSVGTHCVIAKYSGDPNNLPSASPSLCFTTDQAEVSIAIETKVERTQDGITAVLTITLRALPPGSGVPLGELALFHNSSPLGTVSLDDAGKASAQVSRLSDERNEIRVEYSGNTNFRAFSGIYAIGPARYQYMPLFSFQVAAHE